MEEQGLSGQVVYVQRVVRMDCVPYSRVDTRRWSRRLMVMNGPGSRDMGVVGMERGTSAHVDQGEGGIYNDPVVFQMRPFHDRVVG